MSVESLGVKKPGSMSCSKMQDESSKNAKPEEFDLSHLGVVRSAESLQALEPRILLDAAGMATGMDAIEQARTEQVQEDVEQSIRHASVAPWATAVSRNDQAVLAALAGNEPMDADPDAQLAEQADAPGTGASSKVEIAFIDAAVEDATTLLAQFGDNVQVYTISPESDGVEQIASVLADHDNVDAVHIISHGRSGTLDLGTAKLTEASMRGRHADEMIIIREALSQSADILLYGCNFGAHARGASAVEALATLTGADVAASEDLTGAANLGGDWDLEVRQGQIETSSIASSEFTGTLDTFELGNIVWDDTNANGVLDGSESGIDGVVVNLLQNGSVFQTDTTTNGGQYNFSGLTDGDYVIEIAASNFTGAGALVGRVSSLPDNANAGSAGDNDDDGVGQTPDPTDGIRSDTISLVSGGVLEDNLGDGLSEAIGTNPPSVFPAITNGNIAGDDNSVSVLVGGDYTINAGAEAEGLIVVVGDFETSASSGFNSLGRVGVGSQVVPEAGQDTLIVGGDIDIGGGTNITVGFGTTHNVRAGGEINDVGNIFSATGDETANDSTVAADIAAFEQDIADLQTRSAFWATLPSTGTVTVTGGGVTFAGAGTDDIQVFNITPDQLDLPFGTPINFDPNLAGKTIIINVEADGSGVVRINNVSDMFAPDGSNGFNFDPEFTGNVLWNIPSATTVELGATGSGNGQFWGSVVIGDENSTTTMGFPGHNGRFFTAGSLIQDRAGNEFHNYEFDPTFDLPQSISGNNNIIDNTYDFAFTTAVANDPPTLDLDFIETSPTPGQDGFIAFAFTVPIIANDGQSELADGVGNGETALFENVGMFNGSAVDIRAVVVENINANPTFNLSPNMNGDNANVNMNSSSPNGTNISTVRWEVIDSTTGAPVAANFTLLVTDLDQTGNQSMGFRGERISISEDAIDGFVIADNSDLMPIVNNGVLTFQPSDADPGTPGMDETNAVQLIFTSTSSFEITYDRSGAANFTFDGNFTPIFTNPQTTDTNPDHADIFLEGGSVVPIATDNIQIADDMDGISRVTATLTNAQTDDLIAVTDTLPMGIAVDPSSTASNIILTGNATADDYEQAIQAITFQNVSADPQTAVVREITIVVEDDATQASNTATTRIQVVSVNDPPAAVDDTFTTDGTAIINGDLLADNGGGADSDGENDTLTVTEVNGVSGDVGNSASLASGALVTVNSDGTFSYDPNGFNGPTDTFTYTIDDGNGATDTATVTIGFGAGLDTDGDGVLDVDDIDDDNDGILDTQEGFRLIDGFTIGTVELTENGDGSGFFRIPIIDELNNEAGSLTLDYFGFTGDGDGPGGPGFGTGTAANPQFIAPTLEVGEVGGEVAILLVYALPDIDGHNYGYSLTSTGLNFTGATHSLQGEPFTSGLPGRVEGGAFTIDHTLSQDPVVIRNPVTGAHTINGVGLADGQSLADGTVFTRSTQTSLNRFLDLGFSLGVGETYGVDVSHNDRRFEGIDQTTFVLSTAVSIVVERDSDQDGISDHLDIDSDNDGITDTIEAQTSDGFIAPSGVAGTQGFTDVNRDGLDDNLGGVFADIARPNAMPNLSFDHNSTPFPGGLEANSSGGEVVSGSAVSFGAGFTASAAGTATQLIGTDRATLEEAIAANAFIQFDITTSDNPDRLLALSSFSTFGPRFDGDVAILLDGELAAEFDLANIGSSSGFQDFDIGGLVALQNNATHTIQIVIYGAPNTVVIDSYGFNIATADVIVPVDSDSDGDADYVDTDSDNDGLSDTLENGLGQAEIPIGTLSNSTNDADGDGLFDQFENAIDGNINDGFVVAEGVTDPLTAVSDQNGYLPDRDADAVAGAVTPLTADLDFRDLPNPPVLDLNSTASVSDTDRDFSSQFTAGSAAVPIVDVDADVLDGGRISDFTFLTITPTGNFPDGTSEILQIAGVDIPLSGDFAQGGVLVPGTTAMVDISFHDGVITVREQSNGSISNADMDALIRSVTYRNMAATPSDANDRMFDFQVAQFDPATFVIDFEELTAGGRATSAQIGSSVYYGSEGVTSTGADTLNGYIAAPGVRTDSSSSPLGLGAGADGNFLFHNTFGVAPAGENTVFGRDNIPVEPNTDYTISVDLGRVNSVAAGPFQIVVNDVVLQTISVLPVNMFETFTVEFANGDSTSANFEIRNLSVNPTGNDFGIDNISFQREPIILSNVATATVEVIARSLPVAQDDNFSINEDPEAGTAEIGIITDGNLLSDNGNGVDSDADNDPLTVTQINNADITNNQQITLPSGALLTIRTDGTFDYDPNGAFDSLSTGETDTDTFTYTLSDGGDTDTATVTITITGDNDAPVVDLNGALPGTDYNAVFIEDTPGEPLTNLLTFDAIVQDDENNITTVEIAITLPAVNDGSDELFRIDEGALQLTIDLGTGTIIAPNPLTFGSTTFDVSYAAGVITIQNATGAGQPLPSDDLQGFMRLLAYQNLNQNNAEGNRIFEFRVIDPFARTIATSTLTVSRTNDSPVPTVIAEPLGTVVEVGGALPSPIVALSPQDFATVAQLTGDDVRTALSSGAIAQSLGLISVQDLLGQLDIVDAEGDEIGIGVTFANEYDGRWQYLRTDLPSHEWTDFQVGDEANIDPQPVPDGEALLFNHLTVFRFVADIGFSGAANLEFRVWDGTAGTASNPPSTILDDSGGQAPTATSSLSSTAFLGGVAGDYDGDGVNDIDDLDDDNDGILDTVENLGTGFANEATVLVGPNLYESFNGGTFGFASGAPDESPATDPYAGAVTGGSYDQFDPNVGSNIVGGINHGEYTYISNQQTPRFSTHAFPAIDPVYGETGRFFLSDPSSDTPTLSDVVTGLIPGSTYEYSFWAATPENSSSQNNIDVIFNGSVVFSTGPLGVSIGTVNWIRHSFEFVAPASGTLNIDLTSTETGSRGNDFYLDNIELRQIVSDTDGDGIANSLDVDSDNDGISDLIESGQDFTIVDINNDGFHDGGVDPITGIPLAANGGAGVTPVNSDTDTLADYLDLDSDDDLIADQIEAQPTAGYQTLTNVNNATNFGVNDIGLFAPSNTDANAPTGDTRFDFRDNDSDADGMSDELESGLARAGTDNDNNGIDDGTNADYGDGDGDINDPTADPGGLANEFGDRTQVGYRERPDTDGDGVDDVDDIDDDNDGILDTAEGATSGGLILGPQQSVSASTIAPGPSGGPVTTAGSHSFIGPDGTVITITDITGNQTTLDGQLGYRIGTDSATTDRTYTVTFSQPVGNVNIGLGFINNDVGFNTPSGEERIGNFTVNAGTVSLGWTDDGDGVHATLFDGTFVSTVPGGFGAQSGGVLNLSSDQPFDTITFQYDSQQSNPFGIIMNQVEYSSATISGGVTGIDTDGDGIFNHLDIDSDNDGITDNIEAQTTAGYIAPSGTGNPDAGGSFVDTNRDGLDDAYDSGVAALGDLMGHVGDGLNPVNTDGETPPPGSAIVVDATPDYLDTDSDGDGLDDASENGLNIALQTGLSTSLNDADGDGLFDVFETAIDGNANDGFVVNEGIADPLNTAGNYLPDAGGDASVGTAIPLINDLDYRDINDGPVAQNDTGTTDEDTELSGSVFAPNGTLIGDIDPDGDTLNVTRVATGNDVTALGTLADGAGVGIPVAGSNGGTFTVNSDGSYSFDPGDDFNGLGVGETMTTQVVYQIDDGNGGTDTAVVTITMEGRNDGPIPVDPTQPPIDPGNPPIGVPFDPQTPFEPPMDPQDYIPAQTGEDGALQPPFDLTPYFGDPDSTDTITLTIDPADLPPGLLFDGTSITGTPDADASQQTNIPGGTPGTYVITITATDPSGAAFTTSVTFTINNPAPVAQDDTGTTDEDTELSGSVFAPNGTLIGDIDPDGDPLNVTRVASGNDVTALGTLADGAGVGIPVAGSNGGLFTIGPDGSYTFDPGQDFNGLDDGETVATEVVYQIDDGEGGVDTAVVTILVEGSNDAPVVIDPNDPGPDPANPVPADPATVIPVQAVTDGEDFSATPLIDVSVFALDPDGTDEPITFTTVDPLPNGLVLNLDGTVTGVVDSSASQGGPNGNGIYPVMITISDGDDTSTVTLMINVTNPPPVAVNDTVMLDEDDLVLTGNVITDPATGDNDTAPDNDVLTVVMADQNGMSITVGTPFTLAGGGILTLNDDGSYMFDPGMAYNGLDEGETVVEVISYTVDDGNGGTDTATLTLTVTGSNDAPVIVDPANPGPDPRNPVPADPLTVVPVQVITDAADYSTTPLVDISAYVIDPDGSDEPLIFTTTSPLPAGLVLNPDGTVTGVLDNSASQGGPNGDGTYPITITISDGDDESTVTLVIDASNPPPVAVMIPDQQSVEGFDFDFNITGFFDDTDDDDLTFSAVGLPDGLFLDPLTGGVSGTLSGFASSRGPGGDGLYPVIVTADDGEGGLISTTFLFTVLAQQEANDTTPQALPVIPADFTEVPVVGPVGLTVSNAINGSDAQGLRIGLDADQPVQSAVNGVAPLGGNTALGDRAISSAISAATETDRLTGTGLNAHPYRGGQIDLSFANGQGTVTLRAVTSLDHIHVDLKTFGTAPILDWDIRMGDGSARPAWINMPSSNSIIIERVGDVDTVDVIIFARLRDGSQVSIPVQIDMQSGAMTTTGEPLEQSPGEVEVQDLQSRNDNNPASATPLSDEIARLATAAETATRSLFRT